MILGALCLLGFGFAWMLGADPRRLVTVRLRFGGLILAALGLQLLVYAGGVHLPARLGGDTAAHVGSYLLLIGFALRNLRTPGLLLAATGLATNAAAILSNGGHMPVTLAAWRASGRPAAELARTGVSNNTSLLTGGTHLPFLGDVFALPAWVPLANTFSIGDVLLVAGAVVFVYRNGRRERDRALVPALDPLRVRDFRTLLAGRTVSKLGDWISLAALVTWIYARTHSTLGVSLVLLARLAASVAGGLAGSALLDGRERFRVLRGIETARALATLGAIGLVAAGQPYAVAAFVFASYFLAAATDPTASSLVADVLAPEARHAGNALHAIARASVMAVGSVAGGLAATSLGVLPALGADVATFAVAAALYAGSVGRVPAPAGTAPSPASSPALRRTGAASFLARSRGLRALVASFAAATLAMGLLNASLPSFLAAHAPHVGGYGVGLGAIALGLVCGEFASGRISERVAARTPALAFAVGAALLAVASTSRLATTVLLLLFLLGVADGATETAYDTLVQGQTPPSLRAGVFALGGALQQAAMGVGFVLSPVLAWGGAVPALRASAVALAAAALVGLAVVVAGRVAAVDPQPVAPSV